MWVETYNLEGGERGGFVLRTEVRGLRMREGVMDRIIQRGLLYM
jgi:hypothetical protein